MRLSHSVPGHYHQLIFVVPELNIMNLLKGQISLQLQ